MNIDWGFIGVVVFAVVLFFATEFAFQWIEDKKRGIR